MTKTDKVLACCSHGYNRSVHCKSALNERGYRNVLTIGLSRTNPETVAMLCQWADVILIVGEDGLCKHVPEEYHAKTSILPIGHDKWGWKSHKSLTDTITTLLGGI